MTDFTAYLILAQRNNDIESWVNILFIVVMAVFWIVGGIIKSKAQKKEFKSGQNKPVRPARKAKNEDNSFWEQFLGPIREAIETERQAQQVKKTTIQQQKAKAGKMPAKAKIQPQAVKTRSVSDKKIAEPETSIPVGLKPTLSSEVKISQPSELEVPVEPEISEIDQMQFSVQQQIPERLEKPSESPGIQISLFDDFDPDELKRAIIYHEILGKPLSERSPLN